ncbi:hypothetical protein phiE131_040 [Burkholderia phage phiE131]|nr:hypothetical protein [Burkholderia thailandensis]AYJ74306.1 hypothetical protein phiE131_040 [Burkholderia phage phiE131]AYJ74376.1 hypothetical protein phiE058_040 [Burkholderia phage phiE058]
MTANRCLTPKLSDEQSAILIACAYRLDEVESQYLAEELRSVQRTLLAASPVEQPAAAPIERAKSISDEMMDLVDRLGSEWKDVDPHAWQHLSVYMPQPAAAPIPEDCDVRNILLDVVPGEDGEGQEVYARNIADVERLLSEMGEKLDAVDAAKQPAPSPADERAAWVDKIIDDLQESFDTEGITENDSGDALIRLSSAIAAVEDAAKARAASANETGAEEAAEPYDEGDIERHFDDHGFYLHGFEEEDRANFFEAALALVAGRSPAMAAEAVAIRNAALDEAAAVVADHQRKGREWIPTSLWGNLANEAANRIRALKSATPQPAQADARVGLTAAARATIMDACQSISRRADEIKESNVSADGTWCDADEKAFYYAELSLLERLVSLLATTQQPRAEVTEEQPSLTNPLTPYGMLVRALRIVSGTTLMGMAQHLGRGPAELSAIEFGRKPVRDADIVDAAHFFACVGIQSTTHALTIAARAGGQHADQA